MHILLYVSAILCALIGVLFAFPLIIVAPFLAGLGAIVQNTRPQKPAPSGHQPSTGDMAPDNPPNQGTAGRITLPAMRQSW